MAFIQVALNPDASALLWCALTSRPHFGPVGHSERQLFVTLLLPNVEHPPLFSLLQILIEWSTDEDAAQQYI